MSEQDRATALDAMIIDGGDDSACGQVAEQGHCHRAQCALDSGDRRAGLTDSDWVYHSKTLPVDPQLIAQLYGTRSGIADRANRMRWGDRENCVSADKGVIPDDAVYTRRLSCGVRHPGLCFTRDAAIYANALLLARNLEVFYRESYFPHLGSDEGPRS